MEINKIFNMDVFDFFNKTIHSEMIDLAIVDPPYNISQENWDFFKTEKEYWDFTFQWIDQLISKMKKTGSLYLFNSAYNSAIIVNYLLQKGLIFQNWIVWYKKDGFSVSKKKYVNNQETILFFTMSKEYCFNGEAIRIPYESKARIKHAKTKGILKNGKRWFPNENGKLCPDVWNFASTRHSNKVNGKLIKSLHPTPKPEAMLERMILASSNRDDLVLDLFSGSGITSYVAKKFKRNFIGCENENNYVKMANERLKTLEVK